MASLADSHHEEFYAFSDRTYLTGYNNRLNAFRKRCELTDIFLKAGNVTVPCHKVVLAQSCKYFSDVLSADAAIPTSIYLNDVDPLVLETVVEYFYTGEIKITCKNVQEALAASCKFNMQAVRTECLKFIFRFIKVQPTNISSLLRLAAMYNIQPLKNHVMEGLASCFQNLANHLSVADLKVLTKKEVVECIKKDDLGVDTEDKVLDFVIRWTEADLEQRKAIFDNILKHVRLPYCSSGMLSHITDVLKPIQLLSETSKDYILEASKSVMNAEHAHEMAGRIIPPRANMLPRCLLLMGGVDQDNRTVRTCWISDIKNKMWINKVELPKATRLCSACLYQGGILVTGGKENHQCSDMTWFLDLHSLEWKRMPPLLQPRGRHTSVECGGHVYVIGGEGNGTSTQCLDSVEKHDGRRWCNVAPMTKAMKLNEAVALHKNIYVLGGLYEARQEGNEDNLTLQVYDTIWDEWTVKAPMPLRCRFGGAVIRDNIIYVVGGQSKVFMSYSIAQDFWTVLSPPSMPHCNGAAVLWAGKVLVAGGSPATDQIEEYDPEQEKWCTWETSLPLKLTAHCLLNIPLHGQ